MKLQQNYFLTKKKITPLIRMYLVVHTSPQKNNIKCRRSEDKPFSSFGCKQHYSTEFEQVTMQNGEQVVTWVVSIG